MFMPVASQALLSLAQRLNSRSVVFCQLSACSAVRPSTSRSIRLFRRRPTPTTFVRLVLIAEVATGAAMYNMRARCLMVKLLKSMSSCADPLGALKPFTARFLQLAPASP